MNECIGVEKKLFAIENRFSSIVRWQVFIAIMMSVGIVFAVLVIVFSWFQKHEIVDEIRENRSIKTLILQKLTEIEKDCGEDATPLEGTPTN